MADITEAELENNFEAQVECAKLSEQMDRYEEMAKHMKRAAQLKADHDGEDGEVFTDEQRNLFSVAYKNVVGSRRSAWRQLASMKAKIKPEESPLVASILSIKEKVIVNELTDICNEVLEIIKNYLLKNDKMATETKVFYCKMKGDYYRYLAEVTTDKEKKIKECSCEAYQNAVDASGELQSTHPIRLGLALNFSVFYYEIMNEPDKACQLAKKAFDDAISELDSLKEDTYKDSTLIMQLLRDNLTLWTSDTQNEEEPDPDAQ